MDKHFTFPIEVGLISCCCKQSENIVVYQKDTAEVATSQIWQSAASVRMWLRNLIGLANKTKLFWTIFNYPWLSFILSSQTCKLCLTGLLFFWVHDIFSSPGLQNRGTERFPQIIYSKLSLYKNNASNPPSPEAATKRISIAAVSSCSMFVQSGEH